MLLKKNIQYSPLLSVHRFRFYSRTKTHISENEDAYFRDRKRIFQRTKTHKNENAKKNESAKNEKTQTQKKEEFAYKRRRKRTHLYWALYKSLQIR